MDTTELLKKAWEAVITSGVPAEVQGVALKAAIDDIRGASGSSAAVGGGARLPTPIKRKAATTRPQPSSSGNGARSILSDVGDADEFFSAISRETGAAEQDLRDVFHVEDGVLELKVAAKDLGSNNKAKAMTITALVGGAVFAGTSHTRVPFRDIHAVCKAKRCYDSSNGSSYVKATPGYAVVGSGSSQALTHKSGWENEFTSALMRVQGKADNED